jgi:hypothetical protein
MLHLRGEATLPLLPHRFRPTNYTGNEARAQAAAAGQKPDVDNAEFDG